MPSGSVCIKNRRTRTVAAPTVLQEAQRPLALICQRSTAPPGAPATAGYSPALWGWGHPVLPMIPATTPPRQQYVYHQPQQPCQQFRLPALQLVVDPSLQGTGSRVLEQRYDDTASHVPPTSSRAPQHLLSTRVNARRLPDAQGFAMPSTDNSLLTKTMHFQQPAGITTTQQPAPRKQSRTSTPYSQLYKRVPANATEQILRGEFTRDELRSLLKANRISYHKVGPQNLMKSKAEMAANLVELIRTGKLAEQPVSDESDGHDRPKKKRKSSGKQQREPPPPQQQQQQPSMHLVQMPMRPGHGVKQLGTAPAHLGGSFTPRARVAAEIIVNFPASKEAVTLKQHILGSSASEEEYTDPSEASEAGPMLGGGRWRNPASYSAAVL